MFKRGLSSFLKRTAAERCAPAEIYIIGLIVAIPNPGDIVPDKLLDREFSDPPVL